MDDTSTYREDDPSRLFYDPVDQLPKPGVRRQTRQASSDVDFRGNYDRHRIPANDNLRRKCRTKPQHSMTYPSQSAQNNSMDARLNDCHRRKNAEKLETSLNQHRDYSTSKAASPLRKNRSVQHQQQSSLLSPRAVKAHQRSQYHRPGSSRNRNNPGNTSVHRASRKHGNIEPCECATLVSTLGNIVNSDVETEDSDFALPDDPMHSRNVRKQSDLYWPSPPGEPHFEPETDSPVQNRHRDYPDSKKRHSGQGESVYENCRDTEAKLLIETGSSVDKDIWQQCERDQQELKELYEDVGEFARRKSAGQIASNNLHEDEDYALDHPKQQRGKKENETVNAHDLLESISQFIGKDPAHRKGYPTRVANVGISAKVSKARSNISKEQLKDQSSKLDTRKPYHSVGMDGLRAAVSQQQEVEENLDAELAAAFKVENLKQDEEEEEEEEEEETNEVECLSETEEEARELVREDTQTAENIHRQLKKSWAACKRYTSVCRPRISGNGERTTRDQTADREEKTCGKPDCGKKRVTTRETSKGRQEKARAIICEQPTEPLRLRNRVGVNEATHPKDCKRTREQSRPKDEMADKMYEEFKNCYGVSAATHGTGDLELETSKTKTCIDEIIDNGLSREAKRANGAPLQGTAKELECEEDGPARGALQRGTSDEPSKIIRSDCFCPGSQNDELSKAIKGDCFCKTLAEIVTDRRDPRECVRKLKSFRWSYINQIQGDLEKLYSLEKFLDLCSPERRPSSVTFATDFPQEAIKESKIAREKRDKHKGSATQSRM